MGQAEVRRTVLKRLGLAVVPEVARTRSLASAASCRFAKLVAGLEVVRTQSLTLAAFFRFATSVAGLEEVDTQEEHQMEAEPEGHSCEQSGMDFWKLAHGLGCWHRANGHVGPHCGRLKLLDEVGIPVGVLEEVRIGRPYQFLERRLEQSW